MDSTGHAYTGLTADCIDVCAQIGTWYETMEHGYVETTGLTWSAGSAVYVYNNTQRAAPLWYHDHT